MQSCTRWRSRPWAALVPVASGARARRSSRPWLPSRQRPAEPYPAENETAATLATVACEARLRLPSRSRPAELVSTAGRAAPSGVCDRSYPRAGGEVQLEHGIDETHQAPQCGCRTISHDLETVLICFVAMKLFFSLPFQFRKKADVAPYLMCMKPSIKLH